MVDVKIVVEKIIDNVVYLNVHSIIKNKNISANLQVKLTEQRRGTIIKFDGDDRLNTVEATVFYIQEAYNAFLEKYKNEHLGNLDMYYKCLTKEPYYAILTATRAAYLLSEFRSFSPVKNITTNEKEYRNYEPYLCEYCNSYHIGRVNRKKRPL